MKPLKQYAVEKKQPLKETCDPSIIPFDLEQNDSSQILKKVSGFPELIIFRQKQPLEVFYEKGVLKLKLKFLRTLFYRTHPVAAWRQVVSVVGVFQ